MRFQINDWLISVLALAASGIAHGAGPREALPNANASLSQLLSTDAPDSSQLLPNGETIDMFVAAKHPTLQQLIDNVTGVILHSAYAREALREVLRSPEDMVFNLGVSNDFAERYTQKKIQVESTEGLSSEDKLKIALKQIFANRYAWARVQSGNELTFQSWSNETNITALMLDPSRDSSADWVKTLIHEIAIRRDAKASYADWAIEHQGGYNDPYGNMWGNPTLQLSFSILRSYRFEARIVSELAPIYEIDMGPNHRRALTMNKRTCNDLLSEIAHHIKAEGQLGAGRESPERLAAYLAYVRRQTIKVGKKKQDFCLFWSEPDPSVAANLNGKGGPRPRMGGW